MEKFYISDYLKSADNSIKKKGMDFKKLCKKIYIDFMKEWESADTNLDTSLRIQKNAIIGYENEVSYFKSRIKDAVFKYGAEDSEYPGWYGSIEDGIYHENWGLAGMAEWFSEKYESSSSAKIIGDNIFFLENGSMVLKPQTINKERREQLIRAFLLLTPEERMDKEFHEIYMLDGTRITVFCDGMAKKGQDALIFRRYIVPNYSFEEQYKRKTIPKEAIELFKIMVKLGYNLAFTGAVRSAKTTFLSTWQSYEDKTLEGVLVETDPEIPIHKIMPGAPILQLIADGEKLSMISKNLLRSDADYFVMGECRDGVALDTAVKIASKGTRRMKITFHSRNPEEFCYDVAYEIIKIYGGDLNGIAQKVALSFDYIFHFVQLNNKSEKRLKSIYELSLSNERKIITKEICRYDYHNENWNWFNNISTCKKTIGEEENPEAMAEFEKILDKISNKV